MSITEIKAKSRFTYLALGDSYTLGEGVSAPQSWPVQLANRLNSDSIQIKMPKIIAKTGWRTDELLEQLSRKKFDSFFDLVTLQIGVNNQYQNKPIIQFKTELKTLLIKANQLANNGSKGVFVLSIPDYSITPFARMKNISKISDEIKEYNHITKQISLQKGISFIDITPISKKALHDTTLLASDGLHPSPLMYTEWVNTLYSYIFEMLYKKK